jgi:hypothetical protein
MKVPYNEQTAPAYAILAKVIMRILADNEAKRKSA